MNSIIVFVAEYFLYLSVIVTGLFWLRCRKSTKIELLIRFVLGGVIALALAKVGAYLYYDPRPFVTEHVRPLFPHAADNGFPSDHMLLTSFLGFTILAYSKRTGMLLLVIALAVGAARVAAHVHSPIDIVGSTIFAAVGAFIAARVSRSKRLRSRWS